MFGGVEGGSPAVFTYGTGIRPCHEAVPVGFGGSPEHFLRDVTSPSDGEGKIRTGKLRIDLHDGRCYDAKRATAAAAQGPEEVLIFVFIGRDEPAVCSYDLKSENLVSRSDGDELGGRRPHRPGEDYYLVCSHSVKTAQW